MRMRDFERAMKLAEVLRETEACIDHLEHGVIKEIQLSNQSGTRGIGILKDSGLLEQSQLVILRIYKSKSEKLMQELAALGVVP